MRRPASPSSSTVARCAYTVKVGTLPVKDKQGKVVADVVYTAYTMDGKDRPVTFALNGGPGAASGVSQPGRDRAEGGGVRQRGRQRLGAGAPARQPRHLAGLHRPGVHRPGRYRLQPLAGPDEQAKKQFYNPQADVEYLSRTIYDWLLKNQRLQSRKYLVGESYGGFRGPRITHYLQTKLGVAMNGVVLVSPYLNPTLDDNGDVSPLPWMLTLPSIAAAHLEREGKLTPEAMRQVIDYTRGDYVTALLRGRSDPAGTTRMIQQVTAMTGLDPAFVRRAGGRLETQAYLREVFRDKGELGSRYDSNVTAFDPFPNAPEQRANDPLLDSIIAPTTTAMVDFVTRVVGWKIDARYEALNYDVNRLWDWDDELRKGSVTQLRQSVAIDPKLRVLIVHGWNDLSCPFMGSVLTVDQMPVMGNDPTRVQVKNYPGGHMFYNRADSQRALREDVLAMYRAN